MARSRKISPFTCLLLVMVLLLSIGLLGVLLADSRYQASSAADDSGDTAADTTEKTVSAVSEAGPEAADTEMPEWLQPAEPEPVQEKSPPEGALTAPEILSNAQVIAHGLGAIDGTTTLNCLEGFQQQYAQGVRVFEVDLRLTADQQVVLRHDWRAGWQEGVSETAIPTLEEFLDKPLLEKYTPLSFQDLLLLMEEYPDICIVTDTKFTDAEIVTLQFDAMLSDAKELGLSYLFDRMVIQVYSQLMYTVTDSLHHFPYYFYTLYTEGFGRTEEAFRELAAFCSENGIMGITMWDYWWDEDYVPIAQEYGVQVFTHTVNDSQEALTLLSSGISAVYTDTLVPGDLTGQGE